MRETIEYKTEKEWLDARRLDITSTEAAGLFGVGAYEGSRTPFELYHKKARLIAEPEFSADGRVKWGTRLESAIAMGIAEDYGVVAVAFKNYMRMPEFRLAASFDFRIVGLVDGFTGDQSVRDMFKEFGVGNLEVKNIDSLQFRRNWIDDGETIEATPQIEFQAQAQMEVADLEWSLLAPLVGGNTPKVVIRKRDREIGKMIRDKAAELWQRIAAGNAPAPDFTKDGATISKLYVENDGSHLDLSGDPRVFALCKTYKDAAAEAKEAEARKQAAKAELLTIVKAAKTASAPGFKISAGTRRESYRAYHREAGERVTITLSQIPAADIEATVPAYRDVRISEGA